MPSLTPLAAPRLNNPRVGDPGPEQKHRLLEQRCPHGARPVRSSESLLDEVHQPSAGDLELAVARQEWVECEPRRGNRCVAARLRHERAELDEHRALRSVRPSDPRAMSPEPKQIQVSRPEPRDPEPNRETRDPVLVRNRGDALASHDRCYRADNDFHARHLARERVAGQDSLAMPALDTPGERNPQHHKARPRVELAWHAASCQAQRPAAALSAPAPLEKSAAIVAARRRRGDRRLVSARVYLECVDQRARRRPRGSAKTCPGPSSFYQTPRRTHELGPNRRAGEPQHLSVPRVPASMTCDSH